MGQEEISFQHVRLPPLTYTGRFFGLSVVSFTCPADHFSSQVRQKVLFRGSLRGAWDP